MRAQASDCLETSSGELLSRSDLVRKAAVIASFTLTLLEGVAHTASARGGSGAVHSRRIVAEPTRVATVALATLEGVARARRTHAGRGGSKSISVAESASTAAVALALLEGIAHAGASATTSTARNSTPSTGVKVRVGTSSYSSSSTTCATSIVAESAGAAAVTLAPLEGVASALGLRSAGSVTVVAAAAAYITAAAAAAHLMAEAASVSTIALT
jgi:hypothetical protein